MLTRKQHELLVFIQRRLNENGVSPSFDEMKEALGLKSKSGIHRLISGLEERGFIRRLPHRARALEILRGPDSGPGGAAANDSASANVVAPSFRMARPRASANEDARRSAPVNLPLYGRIAAGTPIEALRDESAFVEVPPALLSKGEHYCLEVEGDSMVEAGIFDGDTVVIERCDAAENGSIIVALVDGEEVTLKRLRRKGHAIALEPANPAFETRIFPPERVRIQGRLVALLRQY